ncbi:MAG: TIGR03663 family protein, partial [Chloroflexi bacterium]|nr:TIGR03663 family protein [Chloroflexota bacterium]
MAVCDVHFHKATRFERMRPWLIQFGAIAAVAGIAAVTRFRDLGLRTFQGDETVYSLIAAQVSRGDGWEQSTVVHGPVQFFASAAAFRMLGTSDLSARLMPAIFGVLLTMLPLLFARHIGRAGAIVAALLLAVSPVMMYYSRFAGPDIYLAFFTLATAMLLWRYLAAPDRSYLYLMAVTLAFAAVTSEMALAVIGIFAAYLHYRVAGEMIEQARAGAGAPEQPVTHYERLGVARDAQTREIRAAYKAMLGPRGKAVDRDAVTNAFQVLTTANRREAYDRKLAQREMAAAERTETASLGLAARVLLAVTAGLLALAWPFAGRIRRRQSLTRLPDAANPLIVITMLALPFYGPLAERLPFVGDRGFEGQTMVYFVGGTTKTPGGELPVMLVTLGVLFAASMIIGLAWKWHAWVVCWALFYGIVITMFTGFFTDKGSMWTGIWGTLDYWSRPDANVIDGPPYFYAMILPAYELVPIAIATLGVAMLAVRGGWRNRIVTAIGCVALAGVIAAPAWLSPVAQHRTLLALVV